MNKEKKIKIIEEIIRHGKGIIKALEKLLYLEKEEE